ncbi:MAG: PSD1 domain-containing protein [Planctomycetes bacterium]|nr:PSD1 domain-containing protein [Planctomycetota bacterium]
MSAPLTIFASLALVAGAAGTSGSAPALRYDRDVRPILADRCFTCHGPDAKKRQAELRLDMRESALSPHADSPAAILAGDAEHSELWKRITHPDVAQRMPPADSGKRPLSDAEKEILRRWIAEGADYEPHWSFVPPVKHDPPAVKDAHWVRGPIDRFVLARLESEGLAPNPPAERETLLRRVFLDLTGLPPTPEELSEFLADTRTDAYERWVEKLLTQEPYRSRYAEHMAVPWLDAARYGDTNGIHTDAGRSIWPWRDWLLGALREGMPYDEFVREQLAGDLLPDATEAQKVASGFNRNHVMTDEGGAIAEEYLVEYAVDRVNTTSSVFLGVSMGCARCHDHKFDPFTQEDYYSMFSFFDSLEEPGLYSQLPDPKRAFEPFMEVPTLEQQTEAASLKQQLADLRQQLDAPVPSEEAELAHFEQEFLASAKLEWPAIQTLSAASAKGAEVAIQPDGSTLWSGANPDTDDHVLRLRTQATGLRLVALEGLTDPSLDHSSVGRAPNGNAVLSGFRVQAHSIADPAQSKQLHFRWCWADFEQQNGNYRLANVLDDDAQSGWAVDGHNRADPRVALFLTDEPFGFEGGTELTVELDYDSVYPQHVFGRERVRVATLDEAVLARLPLFASGWYSVGPFPGKSEELYEKSFGPEADARLDLTHNFGAGNQYWNFSIEFADARLNVLAEGTNVSYVAKRIYAPSARHVEISSGSDDGLRVYLNGAEVFGKQIDRPLAADQDSFGLDLPSGESSLLLKIVNSGGQAGFYWRSAPQTDELPSDMLLALLPSEGRVEAQTTRIERAWKFAFSPSYRALTEKIAAAQARAAELDASIPRTMVMKELAMPRPTWVLERGQYDHPDKSRPVQRRVPRSLGALPAGAPADRLGLAEWMLAPENPLVARVAVNRVWETLFGTGIVRTSEDFGMQGEWPSHPELLDWLAVDFREHGWSVKRLVREIVDQQTYRQSSRVRADLAEKDPDGRLYGRYPRRRLGAEELRDQALYVSGLLVEKLGGPSVKPYQPQGLWQEIAMPASNTRIYEQGMGEDLWRRSLYTYWKRACPPPSLQTFDAPTRESCVVRRITTNTPLQALVLWNDVQFVEAARVLAQHVLEQPAADAERLASLFERATAREPAQEVLAPLTKLLERFRARYADDEAAAKELVAQGMAPRPMDADARELAAWTMVASTVLNLDATLCRN